MSEYERVKEWKKKNHDKVLEQRRRWYKKHKEEINKKQRQRRYNKYVEKLANYIEENGF